MSLFLEKIWYGGRFQLLRWLLCPMAWIFQVIVQVRCWFLRLFCQQTFNVPIIVVGNITSGGVGKTPLVIELAKRCQAKGLRVGIVSRGYKAKISNYPYEVQPGDCALKVGDEPLLLAMKTQCPVIIALRRTQAVQYLLDKHQSQIIISDDGLQHYRMGRAIEIAVIDGLRGLGNGHCLPAGPLRESKSRLKRVDLIVVNQGLWENGFSMTLKPGNIIKLSTGEKVELQSFKSEVAAVAAIGHPARFYFTLSQLGIKYSEYSYPDHYQFSPKDLNYTQSSIIMTEKDAVKCVTFKSDKLYYLPVEAELNDAFWHALWSHEQLLGYC
ncbi:MAG: tetraacyldisaccharide 4'-kinase [Legionella sp.]|nr:tetraacyldisaccharide 4'-kinase [Legionella sp.]